MEKKGASKVARSSFKKCPPRQLTCVLMSHCHDDNNVYGYVPCLDEKNQDGKIH